MDERHAFTRPGRATADVIEQGNHRLGDIDRIEDQSPGAVGETERVHPRAVTPAIPHAAVFVADGDIRPPQSDGKVGNFAALFAKPSMCA